jgi:hypothetical protein
MAVALAWKHSWPQRGAVRLTWMTGQSGMCWTDAMPLTSVGVDSYARYWLLLPLNHSKADGPHRAYRSGSFCTVWSENSTPVQMSISTHYCYTQVVVGLEGILMSIYHRGSYSAYDSLPPTYAHLAHIAANAI